MSDVTLNPLECALDEAQALRGQVDALQAENTALREEFNKMDVWHSKELTAAMAENAKLRELACILAWCAVGADCDKCPINTLDFSEWPNGREICYSADDRMRELGVEVDG